MRGFKSFRFRKVVEVSAETVSAECAGSEKRFSSGRLAKVLVMALIVGIIASPLFADDGIPILNQMGDRIISLLNAKWLKAILALALVIEFGVIAFGNSQGEGGMFKKVLPWVIGTAGILAATSIVGFFFNGIDAGNTSYWSYVINNSGNAIGFLSDGIRSTGKAVQSVMQV